MTTKKFDIVIVGGGIAGLWTLAAAREKGYKAILLEKKSLGCGQTLSSQGIIHGGSKYALGGKLGQSTHMISDMPKAWKAAHAGQHAVDISQARLLSTSQYLIPATGIDTKLLSFLGSKTMSSHTQKVKGSHLPDAYKNSGIKQSVFQLNEIVFDTQSVIKCFQKKYRDYLYQYTFSNDCIQKNNSNNTSIKKADYPLELKLDDIRINTKHLVLACGEGFEDLKQEKPSMQTRPLHMVIVKGKDLPLIYAHFIGRSTKPLLTITSHFCEDSEDVVWYLGGGLAEDGVNKSDADQIDIAKKLLQKLTPEITIDNSVQFFNYHINRAEQKQGNFNRPDDAFVIKHNNIITGWPTKLALAPRFAEKVLNEITCEPDTTHEESTLDLPPTSIAHYPWHQL